MRPKFGHVVESRESQFQLENASGSAGGKRSILSSRSHHVSRFSASESGCRGKACVAQPSRTLQFQCFCLAKSGYRLERKKNLKMKKKSGDVLEPII